MNKSKLKGNVKQRVICKISELQINRPRVGREASLKFYVTRPSKYSARLLTSVSHRAFAINVRVVANICLSKCSMPLKKHREGNQWNKGKA